MQTPDAEGFDTALSHAVGLEGPYRTGATGADASRFATCRQAATR
jgi:hypothetical protein